MFNKITQYFWKLENKIAFYPTLIAIAGIVFALLMVFAEQMGVSKYLQKVLPVLVINDIETARNILTSLITGLISILVFSFSMVMIILNRASSNFSPRLLPGLVSNKNHQSILGIHLASIFYCLITLISIEPTSKGYQMPGFSVLIAIALMTVSLAAFIYFIHSISQSIQVEHILKSIFTRAKKRLERLIAYDKKNKVFMEQLSAFKNADEWYEYYTHDFGYIQTYKVTKLLSLIDSVNTLIKVLPSKNTFLFKGLPIFKSEEKLDDETAQQFINQFVIDSTESMEDNYDLAFQLITEIAIKAMSPGINDPGTASTCIDYLTELLSLRMEKADQMLIGSDEKVKIQIHIRPFAELLYNILAPFRAYCSHDIIIVRKLLRMCEYLLQQKCINASYKNTVKQQAQHIIKDAQNKLINSEDIKQIEQLKDSFN